MSFKNKKKFVSSARLKFQKGTVPSHKVNATTQGKIKSPIQISRDEIKQTFPKQFPRIVAGDHAVAEAIKHCSNCRGELWLNENWQSSTSLKKLEEVARKKKINIKECSEAILNKIYQNNQGSLFFTDELALPNLEKLGSGKFSQIIALDGIEDPHNLGAIVRTCWLMGVEAIFLSLDRTVKVNPTVHKVACGGVEHVPIVQTAQFHQQIQNLKEKGYWVYGLSHLGKTSIKQLKLPERVVWILGSEEKGLRTTTERVCDELVQLPQLDANASYNVSVTAALALSVQFFKN